MEDPKCRKKREASIKKRDKQYIYSSKHIRLIQKIGPKHT